MGAFQESVRALTKVDAFFPHLDSQPVVLVQTNPGREGKVGAHAYKHRAPAFIVQIEIVLIHPALFELQEGVVFLLSADRDQDSGWLPRFEDDRNLIGFTAPQIGPDEIIPPLFLGSIDDLHTPLLRAVLEPVLELIGNLGQHPAGDSQAFPIGIEEAEHALGLLEGLNQSVQQNPIEAPISELDAILVVLEKGVHGNLQVETTCRILPWTPPCLMPPSRPARTFRDLVVWRKAHEFVLAVYACTAGFPKRET